MVTNIIRNEDGTVTFPAELMELVERIPEILMADPDIHAFILDNTGERDAFGWLVLMMGLSVSQCS